MDVILDLSRFIFKFNYALVKSIFEFFRQFIFPKRKDIQGELVLITGGAGCLGQLLAIRLGRLGARIVIWDINEEEIPRAKQTIEMESGATVYSYICDISKREEVFRCAQLVKLEVGSVTMLVNNAGIILGQNVLDISEDELKLSFAVNSFAHFYTCQAFLPDMIANGHGHVIAISSIAAHIGLPHMGDYSGSKAATSCMMESLEKELCKLSLHKQINTTLVEPYFILSDMFKGCKAKYNVFPPIQPTYAADRIIQAILSNQKVILLDRNIYLVPILKSLLPYDCCAALDEFLGNYNFMDDFYKLHQKHD